MKMTMPMTKVIPASNHPTRQSGEVKRSSTVWLPASSATPWNR